MKYNNRAFTGIKYLGSTKRIDGRQHLMTEKEEEKILFKI
jgi:hypothetical protein